MPHVEKANKIIVKPLSLSLLKGGGGGGEVDQRHYIQEIEIEGSIPIWVHCKLEKIVLCLLLTNMYLL